MVESGTTITWEAWDMKYKPNQDWNHAWGAAPANLLPRFVLGVTPHTPGWSQATIRPHTAGLKSARGKIPTPRGPIVVDWNHESNFRISVALPRDVTATIELPCTPGSTGVTVNGRSVAADRRGDRWIVTKPISGKTRIEVK